MRPRTTNEAMLEYQLARLTFLRDAAAGMRVASAVEYFAREHAAVAAELAAYRATFPTGDDV